MEIGRSKLQDVLGANKDVLAAAADLIRISRETPDLREKLQPVISKLVNSGALVNTAIASVEGLSVTARGK